MQVEIPAREVLDLLRYAEGLATSHAEGGRRELEYVVGVLAKVTVATMLLRTEGAHPAQAASLAPSNDRIEELRLWYERKLAADTLLDDLFEPEGTDDPTEPTK